MTRQKAKVLLVGLACAGIPLITTASCDPRRGTFELFRDDHHDHHSFIDVIVDEWFYDDCSFWDDCYYEEIVIFD